MKIEDKCVNVEDKTTQCNILRQDTQLLKKEIIYWQNKFIQEQENRNCTLDTSNNDTCTCIKSKDSERGNP